MSDKIPESIRGTILKIKALAEKGAEGEKDAAKRMLKRWMHKYNLSIEDLFEETRYEYKFSFPRDPYEREIFKQCMYKALNVQTIHYAISHTKSFVYFKLTKVEYSDFVELYEWYLKAFRKRVKDEMRVFTDAFIQKNELWPETTSSEPRKPLTREEYNYLIKVSLVAASMDKDTHFKQLSQ